MHFRPPSIPGVSLVRVNNALNKLHSIDITLLHSHLLARFQPHNYHPTTILEHRKAERVFP